MQHPYRCVYPHAWLWRALTHRRLAEGLLLLLAVGVIIVLSAAPARLGATTPDRNERPIETPRPTYREHSLTPMIRFTE